MPVSFHHFRLLDERGNDLGPFVAAAPDWQPGHLIRRGPGDALEVVSVVDAEPGADFSAYLVVRPQ